VYRPKYYFPGKTPEHFQTGPSVRPGVGPYGQTQIDAGGPSRIGPVGQASAALEGLIVNQDAWLISVTASGCSLGPGTLIEFIPNPIPDGHQSGYVEGSHEWFEFDAGGFPGLIGWPKECDASLIEPEFFCRLKRLGGEMIVDPLGKSWLVPVARHKALTFGELPTRWVATSKGYAERIAHEAKSIWEFGGEVFDFLKALGLHAIFGVALDPKWKDPYLIDSAVRVLGINYHFGQAELILLEALGKNPMETEFATEVLHAFTGMDAVREYAEQKKTRDRLEVELAAERQKKAIPSAPDSSSPAESSNSALGEKVAAV
jgi:hypothetical protein